jgi:hypothetical protein
MSDNKDIVKEPENSAVHNSSDKDANDDTAKIKEYLDLLKKKMEVNTDKTSKSDVESNSTTSNNEKKSSQTLSKVDFNEILKTYLTKNKVKLYILTPCYGGLCHVNYVNKIIETKELLISLGIPVVLQFIRNESLITRGRNNLIAKAMSDKDTSHILFIDSDITWDPIDILKLIVNEKELSGGIYPIKKYHWDRLSSANLEGIMAKKNLPYNQGLTNEQLIYHNLLHYNFNYLQNANKIENNCMEVYTLATGFMMIQRKCIEKMIEKYPQYKYTDDCGFLHGDENKYAYALFDCAIVNDHYFSEDWLFCHRWKEIGGKIWADITINLWHTGQEDYCGRLISTLNIN